MPRLSTGSQWKRAKARRRPEWLGRFYKGFAQAGTEMCGKRRAMPQTGLSYTYMFAVCSAKEANHGA